MRTGQFGAAACGLLLCSFSARAYRPYDSTDADVTVKDGVVIELGWREAELETDHEGAISAIFNYGIGHQREIVLEGEWQRLESPTTGTQSSFDDVALSVKQVHRRGSLQGERGTSVASECGLLIPTTGEDSGLGGECSLIASHSTAVLSWHANVGVALETDHRWASSLGLIVEAPESWRVRPGLELLRETVEGEDAEVSMLLGAAWNPVEGLAFDLAYRRGIEPSSEPSEWRIGLTWSP
jgi:hypothetical protein